MPAFFRDNQLRPAGNSPGVLVLIGWVLVLRTDEHGYRQIQNGKFRSFSDAVFQTLEMPRHAFEALRLLPMAGDQRPGLLRHFAHLSAKAIDDLCSPPAPCLGSSA